MKSEDIKFKAKALNSGKWVEGDLVHRITDTCIATKDMDDIVYYPVDPSTVCQFTGLKDCEGKEVWEGDIIEDTYKTEIVFDQGAFLIHSINNNGEETFHSLFNYIEWNGRITCKVVGNKFDKKK